MAEGGGKIDLYNLGSKGVNVTKSPIHMEDGELLSAQNAIPDPRGQFGAITKRDGLTPINSSATGASILAAVLVPLPLQTVRTLYLPRRALDASQGWWTSTDAFASAASIITGGTPANPRDLTKLGNFLVDERYSGHAGCVCNNTIYYAGDDYIQYPSANHAAPTIRKFDGTTDIEVCRIPPNVDVGATTNAFSITSMLTVKGKIYVATFDGDISVPDTSYKGSVFELDPITGNLRRLGTTITGGVPYCLASHLGKIWVGTRQFDTSQDFQGKVYSLRPETDLAWTLELTAGATYASILSLQSYRGEMFAGLEARTAVNAVIKKRDITGAWTTVETGTGTSILNGYSALTVFNDALYAAYWNNTGGISFIRKFDGTTWSTVLTMTSGNQFYHAFAIFNGVMYVIATHTLSNSTGLLQKTSNGTSWTDVTARLTASTSYATAFMGEIRT